MDYKELFKKWLVKQERSFLLSDKSRNEEIKEVYFKNKPTNLTLISEFCSWLKENDEAINCVLLWIRV